MKHIELNGKYTKLLKAFADAYGIEAFNQIR